MYYTKTKRPEFKVNYNEMFTEVLEKEGTISKCFSMFHNYSINNQFLAYWQLKCKGMNLQPINSFKGWNKLNRKIKKGEKALYLWFPITINNKTTDDNGNEVSEQKTIFKFQPHWFALEQTDGETIEPETITINGFDFDKVYKLYGIEIIPFEKMNGNIQGYAKTKEKKLAINPIAEDPEMTILHEVAHIALKHCDVKYSDDLEIDHTLKELEAETVAYIVGSILKLSDAELKRSRGYVQGFFKEHEIPEKQAKNIMATANKILKTGMK